LAASGALFAALPSVACAHVLTDAQRAAPTFGWRIEPWVGVLMAVSLAAYAVGWARLWQRAHVRSRAARTGQLVAFALGWLSLVGALLSPLDTLSDALFSAHMVQHESMMLIAAPLFVLGRPLGVWIWALPRGARQAVGRGVRSRGFASSWRWLSAPLTAWILHAAALWAWHAPLLFEAALRNPAIHTLQHASFLSTALLFWWTVFGESGRRRSSGHAMLSLFTTMVHTSALGALISLSPGLWYPYYVEPTSALGVDPLHDQQLGGLIMWVPGALAYLIGALAVAARWLNGRATPLVVQAQPCAVEAGGEGAP